MSQQNPKPNSKDSFSSANLFKSLKYTDYPGEILASYRDSKIDANFEPHIEEDPILKDEQKKIGIVTGVQACYWEKINVHGVTAQAVSAQWRSRKDTILA